jgi:hypothetical protein
MSLDATSPVYGQPWFASSPVYGEDDRYGGEGFSPASFDAIELPLTAMATLKPIEHPGAYTQPGITAIARPTAMYSTR